MTIIKLKKRKREREKKKEEDMFESCFRMLAVILVSDFLFVGLYSFQLNEC